jgi:hypothetical protein
MDRRAKKERRGLERRKVNGPVVVERRQLERRAKVQRRRQIDPTTCERDYTDAEVEFMNALDEYKRKSGRMFPTCSEILEVIRDLGYEKRQGRPAAAPTPSADNGSPEAPFDGRGPDDYER